MHCLSRENMLECAYAWGECLRSNGCLEQRFTLVKVEIRLTSHLHNVNLWAILTGVVALILFLSTLQMDINGSEHPYATDVGNIQNALSRWGLIHRPGYPLYCLGGSIWVSGACFLGLNPAAASSLWSAIWGAVTVALLTHLAHRLGTQAPVAALGALAVGLSTSLWVDASLAEVHTVTTTFIVTSLLLALRFETGGSRSHLLMLTLAFSQGVAHNRSILLLAPAVLLLLTPHLRSVVKALLPMTGLAALAPLVYLYLPIRAWQGAQWMSSISPGTWDGFWAMLVDTKVERIVQWPGSLGQALERAEGTLGILADDLPLPVLGLGLMGLLLPVLYRWWRQALALTLAWTPYLLLCILIWEGHVSDALLAAKLPIVLLSGVGLSLMVDQLIHRLPRAMLPLIIGMTALLIGLGVTHRPTVLSISHDRGAEEIIAAADQVAPPADSQPIAFMALWGRDFWAMSYAQAFRGQLPGLDLVPHDADLDNLVTSGHRLLTLSRTLYRCPISWWETRLGRVHLTSASPSVVEISTAPLLQASEVPAGASLDLEGPIRILSADVTPASPEAYLLTIYWQAVDATSLDFSVAVHLVAQNPPTGPQDILVQADRPNPVDGWYPTSHWDKGEIVRDHYLISIPVTDQPVAVRLALYRQTGEGQLATSAWLSLPLPT